MQDLINKYLSRKTVYVLLFLSIVLLVLSNILSLILNFQQQPVAYGGYAILFLMLLGAGTGVASTIFLVISEISKPESINMDEPKPKIPDGFQKLFSQPVDPIGNLHLWRVIAEKKESYLEFGPQIVEELESYLERHCEIHRIGSFGDIVLFDGDQHLFLRDGEDLNSEQDNPGNGTPVKIIEPGWRWGDNQILRRPRVR